MLGANTSSKLQRREFLAGTAAAAAFTIVRPSAVRGSEANSMIELALLGCGGRGNWISSLFNKHGKYKWVACCDYYADHADKVGDKLNIEKDRRFTTLGGYKKMYDTKFDAVVIETPPYFHPEQAAAAVAAGKHVFCAKPIAIDVPGCQSVEVSGRQATEKKLVFLIDFQTRANEYYREAAKRIHAGELGKIVCGDAAYPCGLIPMPAPETPEDRLRRWYCNKSLGGDFIVEQSIHSIDVMSWIMNSPPVMVMGRGGSKGLRAYGDIWDYFALVYEFPNNVLVSFMCQQNCPGSPGEIACRIYGTNGTFDSNYRSHVWLRTQPDKVYEGKFDNMFTDGAVTNIKEFYEAVTSGDCSNPTVKPSVLSNLTAIMGREAAYGKKAVVWDKFIKSNDRLVPDLKGLKA